LVAFATSFILTIAGFVGIIAYGRRRPVGAPLSWGESIAAAVGAFFLMFFAYGVVPHQWLTYAGNELSWRPDKILLQSGQWRFINAPLPPFTVNYENLSHIIVVGIYGLMLTLHVLAWAKWQDRAKAKPAEIPTSEYGRPLVKQG
jgi:hypothetical protein